MDEWILFSVAVIICFLVFYYIGKSRITKTEIITNSVASVFLLTLFTTNLINDFTYRRLAITIAAVLISIVGFYLRYKAYRRQHQ